MSEMQDALNQILSNPEAMKQVQSIGEQLGLGKPAPKPEPKNEVSRLLNALRPFLGEEKLRRLDQAQRLMKLIKVIPLLKDSGLFF